MKLGALLATAGVIVLAAQGAPAAPAPADLSTTVSPESVGFDSARLQRLDDYLAGVVSSGKVAGVTALLARHGRVVGFRSWGKANLATGQPMARDEIFRIYSMSKPITGVAMMILFEEGKWRLDDPVTKFVPEFKDLKVLTQDASGNVVLEPMRRPPTMREIMSHTAGFGYGLSDANPVDRMFREKHVLASNGLKEMIDRVATIPLKFQPGTDWSYSIGVDIQGYIVEKISGESLGKFLDEHIFKPLKMNDTAFYTGPERASRLATLYAGDPKTGGLVEATKLFDEQAPDYTKPPLMESGGGGLLSTTTDYARFCQMLLNGGELDGVRILAPATVQLMDTNVIPKAVLVKSNGTVGEGFNDAVGFGLDFMVVKDPRAAGTLEGKDTMSWGGAAGTWFWIDPTNDVVFVGMIQRFGDQGGIDLSEQAGTLTYQALTRPDK
ncbi:MAG: beta-lactamase family protein [Caulobacteraceae bacterium]|nr:beta-lactamase family protein [Caulobacteraceae bacterium]